MDFRTWIECASVFLILELIRETVVVAILRLIIY